MKSRPKTVARYNSPANDPTDPMLVDVLLRRSAQGAKGHEIPAKTFARYNSLANDPTDPSIFVVQHSNQAYPAYLITCSKT